MNEFEFTDDQKTFVRADEFAQIKLDRTKETATLVDEYLEKSKDKNASVRIWFFFFSDSIDKTKALGDELLKIGYSIVFESTEEIDNLFVVSGEVESLKISRSQMDEWTNNMCDLGLKYDSQFEGWEMLHNLESK